MAMNSRNIFASELAKFLRLNGVRVISGECKLSLTTSALYSLNTIFDAVLFTPDGIKSFSNTNEEFFENVKFLFDFMKKVPCLKIFHDSQTLRGGIDVSRFANLNLLEFHKVPMHLVIGLNALSPQLMALFCHRSIYCLKEIFGNSEVDASLRGIWLKLNELNVSYNYLEGFDQSLGLLPNVEYIDASHNNLKHVDELQMLEKIIFLNLSFNLLENIPILSGLSCYSIKILYLRNNILEDLEGIEMLPGLEELDVSYNCISEHSALRSLKSSTTLKSLNLEGNPIYFHKRHRLLTTKHLHSNVISQGILLNRRIMGPDEILKTMRSVRSTSFYTQSMSRHQTAINVIIDGADNRWQSEQNPRTFSIERVPNFGNDEASIYSVEEYPSGSNSSLDKLTVIAHKKRKRKKKRGATILEPKPITDEEPRVDVVDPKETDNDTVPLHIQTKQLLETRRKLYKEEWLIPTEGFQKLAVGDNDITVPPNTPATNAVIDHVSFINTPSDVKSSESVKAKGLENRSGESSNETVVPNSSLQPSLMHVPPNTPISSMLVPQDVSSDVREAIIETYSNVPETRRLSMLSNDIVMVDENVTGSSNLVQGENMNFMHKSAVDSSSSQESDDETEGCLFLVETTIDNKCYSLCVTLRENSLKEINLMTGRRFDLLDLRYLTAVNLNKENQNNCIMCLTFDTVVTSRQKRIYEFDNYESAQTLFKKLKPFADARVMEDTILGALQCLKCSSQFSKDGAQWKIIKGKNPYVNQNSPNTENKDYIREALACPNCSSTVVVEMETMPVPSADIFRDTPTPTKPTKSAFASESVYMSQPQSVKKTVRRISPSFKRKNSVDDDEEEKSKPDVAVSKALEAKKNSVPVKVRRNSNQTNISNKSSSITVISDTESNLDIIPEKNSPCSPISSPRVVHPVTKMSASPPDSPMLNTAKVTPSKKPESKATSSSVTESVEHENSQKFLKYSDSSINLGNIFEGREQFSCEMFTSIDHRLKLHLEVGIFDDEESLLACLETSVIPLSTVEEFHGLFVISSKKIYIMNYQKDSSDRFEKCIKQIYVCSFKKLNIVRTFLGSQGISICCGGDNRTFVLLLRDADLCNCFTSHLSDISNVRLDDVDSPKFLLETQEDLAQVRSEIFSAYDSSDAEILLHLFGYLHESGKSDKSSVCFIVTSECLFVALLSFEKQTKQTKGNYLYHYIPIDQQKISDLIEVKIHENLFDAELVFKDEEKDVVREWIISTQTKSSLLSFISAFKGPWDLIFGIELPLSMK